MVLDNCEQWSFMAEEEYELPTMTSADSRHLTTVLENKISCIFWRP